MFKFEIGQFVITKEGIKQVQMKLQIGEFTHLMPCMVTERITQECPGGTQLFYLISCGGQLVRVHEMELVSISDPLVDAVLDQVFKAIEKLKKGTL